MVINLIRSFNDINFPFKDTALAILTPLCRGIKAIVMDLFACLARAYAVIKSCVFKAKRFDEQESDRLALECGNLLIGEEVVEDYLNKPSICLSHMKNLVKKSGVGTACIRYIFKKSLGMGAEGRIHCYADYSSHLFYLRMGMVPAKLNGDNLHSFIQKLTNILWQDRDKRPNTSQLGGVHMILSQEGIERWKMAVKQGIPFSPFNELEPLQHLMDLSQKEEIKKVLAERHPTIH